MIALWVLLIPYTTVAFAVHGGEIVQNVNRQLRNLICALPFGLVAAFCFSLASGSVCAALSALFFTCAFIGSNMGFDNHRLWVKGFITFPPLGALLLPIAYAGDQTASASEAESGVLYGTVLAAIAIAKALI